MIETKAIFMRKEPRVEATDCVVDKVIRLSGAQYDSFSRNLMRDWDFIRDNPIDTVVDAQGRHHCLLVLGEGREDGILVNPEGGSYARYSAFVPGAAALDAIDRYPYLAERTRQLVEAADYIVSLVPGKPRCFAVSFRTLSDKFGVSFAPYDSVTDIFQLMMNGRAGIDEVRCGAQEFFVHAAPVPEQDLSDAPITREEMREYGYTWDGMEPMDQAQALRIYDSNKEVFLLYPDGTEAAAESREEIIAFDGLFGREIPGYIEPQESALRDTGAGPEEYFEQEFSRWSNLAAGADGHWREDVRYRQHQDGVLYYIGDEDGQYIRIANDGMLTVGRYELASPGIEDAILVSRAWRQYGSYEQALLDATQIAGIKFTADLFSTQPKEKPSVMDQIREARKAPPAPRKQKDSRSKEEPSL